jgi:hypothetical protein
VPTAGRKPKPEEQRRHQHASTHDWIAVADEPYRGHVPDPGELPERTRQWWDVVSRMPHCALWSETDWQFAVDTAHVHAEWVVSGAVGQASELRLRERILGTTLDARRDLRIRYLSKEEQQEQAETTRPISLAERRRELEG